jgi:hypothetical protein
MLQCPEYSAIARSLIGFGILSAHRFRQLLSSNYFDLTIVVWRLTIGNLNWNLDCLLAVRLSLNQPRLTPLWMTSQLLEAPD